MFKFTWGDKKQRMSGLSGINSLKSRYGLDKMSNWGETGKDFDDLMNKLYDYVPADHEQFYPKEAN